MSMKRSNSGRGGAAALGGSEVGGKVSREDLFEELKRRSQAGSAFNAVDVALAIGAGEPQVARALLGLAAEGLLQKGEGGRYLANGIAELSAADFLKAFTRASKLDATRMRDIQEIDRLKRNNDTMRARLLRAQAERDHFKAVLDRHGIDPGPLPVSEALERAEARLAEPAPVAAATPPAAPEAESPARVPDATTIATSENPAAGAPDAG